MTFAKRPNQVSRCRVCNKVAKARGLCMAHYVDLRKLVISGTTTWETLEAQGRSVPPKGPGQLNPRLYR